MLLNVWMRLGLVMGVCLAMGSMLSAQGRLDGPKGLLLWGTEPLGPVYIGANATAQEREAAEWLAESLHKVSGLDWEVRREKGRLAGPGIFVGKTRQASVHRLWPEPGFDEYIVQAVRGGSLFLLGNSPDAHRWAVSDFLQNQVGMRWFIPGELGEVYEHQSRLRIPILNRVFRPSFQDRVLSPMRRGEGRQWGRNNNLIQRFRYNHNLHSFVPVSLFEENPELFPIIEGERAAVSGGRAPQPNIAYPATQAFIADRIIEQFDENPDLISISIATNDSTLFDETEQTQRWLRPYRFFRGKPDYSNLVFHFSNEIARQVAEEHPDRYLTQLSYYFTENVPDFPVQPNLIPYLTFDRAQWFDPEQEADDKATVRHWQEAGPDFLGTWDYYEGSPYFIPRYYPELTARSLRFLSQHGVRNFYAEGTPVWGFDGPRIWLATQLLWNSNQNPRVLLDEYFTRFYGPAAGPMRRFFDRCEEIWMQQAPPGYWLKYFQDSAQVELFPPEVCAELMVWLDEALERVKDSEDREDGALDLYRQRVALTRDAFAFTQAASEYYHLWWEAAREAAPTPAQITRYREQIPAVKATWPGQEHRPRLNVLEHLIWDDPSARGADIPVGGEVLLDEDFGALIIPDEPWGLNSLGAWRLRVFHTEKLKVAGVPAKPEQQGYLRLEGINFFSFYQWLPVNGNAKLWVRTPVRGQVTSGCQAFLQISFMDADGRILPETWRERLPTGHYPDWIPLTLQGEIPPNAKWVYVGIKVLHQFGNDWLEWDGIQVLAE